MSLYVSDVAEIDRLVHQRKDTAIVLYCNGPYCGKSKRLAVELVAGAIRRFAATSSASRCGARWGGVTQIELEDCAACSRTIAPRGGGCAGAPERQTSVFPNAQSIPRSAVLEGKDVGEIKRAKDDGRLPMEDHNTRLVVIGGAVPARHVAEALGHTTA